MPAKASVTASNKKSKTTVAAAAAKSRENIKKQKIAAAEAAEEEKKSLFHQKSLFKTMIQEQRLTFVKSTDSCTIFTCHLCEECEGEV